MGIARIIPFLGLIFCLPALVCRVLGLLKAKKCPEAGQLGHAITATLFGLNRARFVLRARGSAVGPLKELPYHRPAAYSGLEAINSRL